MSQVSDQFAVRALSRLSTRDLANLAPQLVHVSQLPAVGQLALGRALALAPEVASLMLLAGSTVELWEAESAVEEPERSLLGLLYFPDAFWAVTAMAVDSYRGKGPLGHALFRTGRRLRATAARRLEQAMGAVARDLGPGGYSRWAGSRLARLLALTRHPLSRDLLDEVMASVLMAVDERDIGKFRVDVITLGLGTWPRPIEDVLGPVTDRIQSAITESWDLVAWPMLASATIRAVLLSDASDRGLRLLTTIDSHVSRFAQATRVGEDTALERVWADDLDLLWMHPAGLRFYLGRWAALGQSVPATHVTGLVRGWPRVARPPSLPMMLDLRDPEQSAVRLLIAGAQAGVDALGELADRINASEDADTVDHCVIQAARFCYSSRAAEGAFRSVRDVVPAPVRHVPDPIRDAALSLVETSRPGGAAGLLLLALGDAFDLVRSWQRLKETKPLLAGTMLETAATVNPRLWTRIAARLLGETEDLSMLAAFLGEAVRPPDRLLDDVVEVVKELIGSSVDEDSFARSLHGDPLLRAALPTVRERLGSCEDPGTLLSYVQSLAAAPVMTGECLDLLLRAVRDLLSTADVEDHLLQHFVDQRSKPERELAFSALRRASPKRAPIPTKALRARAPLVYAFAEGGERVLMSAVAAIGLASELDEDEMDELVYLAERCCHPWVLSLAALIVSGQRRLARGHVEFLRRGMLWPTPTGDVTALAADWVVGQRGRHTSYQPGAALARAAVIARTAQRLVQRQAQTGSVLSDSVRRALAESLARFRVDRPGRRAYLGATRGVRQPPTVIMERLGLASTASLNPVRIAMAGA